MVTSFLQEILKGGGPEDPRDDEEASQTEHGGPSNQGNNSRSGVVGLPS